MRARFHHLRHDERGMSFVFVGIGFFAFLTATTLAIDVGMFMAARNQAQNSADAGALAGAIALGFNNYTDRSPSGPAVQAAINASHANQVIGAEVSIGPDDVTFPVAPSGLSNRVMVWVYRTAARDNNAVPTLMGTVFGLNTVDIAATATAEASPANAMTCVKPFIIPDRWRESTTGQLATQSDTFEMFDNRGRPLPNPDTYVPSGSGYTGYNNEADRGALLTLRAGNGNNIQPTFYYSLAMGIGLEGGSWGGMTGSDAYAWNIANCNTTIMHRGDLVLQEPGAVVGPTISGVQELMARDPGAEWDVTNKKVINSAFTGQSPRVFPIPLYDPIYYAEGKANGRYADFKVANWIGFFLVDVSNAEIYGRIIPIAGIVDSGSPTFDNSFPIAIRLVQ
jgi:Putative Flp pilus-assembly TadE/G-like